MYDVVLHLTRTFNYADVYYQNNIVKALSVGLDLISIFHSGHLDFSSSISLNVTIMKLNIFPIIRECLKVSYIIINVMR